MIYTYHKRCFIIVIMSFSFPQDGYFITIQILYFDVILSDLIWTKFRMWEDSLIQSNMRSFSLCTKSDFGKKIVFLIFLQWCLYNYFFKSLNSHLITWYRNTLSYLRTLSCVSIRLWGRSKKAKSPWVKSRLPVAMFDITL